MKQPEGVWSQDAQECQVSSQARNIRKILAKTSWYKEKEDGSSGEEEGETARYLFTTPKRAGPESEVEGP